MAALPKVYVTVHKEGALRDVQVAVHGQSVNEGGEVDPMSDPSMVRFSFAGKRPAGCASRSRNGAAIVYREEVQLPPNGGTYRAAIANSRSRASVPIPQPAHEMDIARARSLRRRKAEAWLAWRSHKARDAT